MNQSIDLSIAEIEALTASLDRCLSSHTLPPDETDRVPDVHAIWPQLHGLGLVPAPGATGLALAMKATGRHRAPAPVLAATLLSSLVQKNDAAVAHLLEDDAVLPCFSLGTADPDTVVSAPTLEGGHLTAQLRGVEFADQATHLAVLLETPPSLAIVALGDDTVTVKAQPGLARPAWCDVMLNRVPVDILAVHPDAVDRARRLVRMAAVARAVGAVRRTLELATEHAKTRVQFGQPIGRFQAIQHRLADVLIQLDGIELQLDAAAAAHDRDGVDADIMTLSAFVAACFHLRSVMLALHHTFGAVGFAEEHETPHHFRRVHADLAVLGGLRGSRKELGRKLLGQYRGRLPDLDLGDAASKLREQVRDWLAVHWSEAARQKESTRPIAEQGWNRTFSKRVAERGWIGTGWHGKYAPQKLSVSEQFTLLYELTCSLAPINAHSAAERLIGPALIRFGTEAQKTELLPRFATGEVSICLGYSEPGSGSDLASLRTTARREGDEWVINGQKLWATGLEHSKYIWLAARTDPDAKPAHAGISVFLVPLDTPGITIRPSMAFYGHKFTETFWDDVRVPTSALVGEVNGGWKIITSALADERLLMGGNIAKTEGLFTSLCEYVLGRPDLAESSDVCAALGELGAQLQVARCLVLDTVRKMEAGLPGLHEAGMCKIYSTELMERLGEVALDIAGPSALYEEQADGAACGGAIQRALRTSIMMVIGGGTNDIQRNIVAQRGLELPR